LGLLLLLGAGIVGGYYWYYGEIPLASRISSWTTSKPLNPLAVEIDPDGSSNPANSSAKANSKSLDVIQREPKVLTHPCGASLNIPGGAVRFSPAVRLKEIPKPKALAKAALVAPVLRYDSFAGQVVEGKAVLDLPVGDAGDDAVVLVKSRMGFWLPLPSKPVTLADGRAGRRVTIDRMPAPWIFTVADKGTVPSGKTSGGALRGLAALEQLNWTDKDAMQRALGKVSMRDPDPAGSGRADAGWSLFPRALADEATEKFSDPALGPLKAAIEKFYLARAGAVNNNPGNAWGHYVSGLRYLKRARSSYSTKEAVIDLSFTDPDEVCELRWPKGIETNARAIVVVESLCAFYAPWGLDLTLRMIDGKTIPAEGFDLRVLPPIGELPFTDVQLSRRGRTCQTRGPWDAALDKLQAEKRLDPKESLRSVSLHLYSPRIFDDDWFISTLNITKDYVLRWGPALLAVCSTNPASAVVPIAFGVLDLTWDWMQKEFPPSPTEYATVELTQLGAGAGSDFVELFEDGALQFFGRKLPLGKINKTALFLDVAITLKLVYDKFDPGQIQALATGPLGYRPAEGEGQNNVPPILVVAWLEGPYIRKESDHAYPVGAKLNRTWMLDYEKIYLFDIRGLSMCVENSVGDELRLSPTLRSDPSGKDKSMAWQHTLKPLPAEFFPSVETVDKAPQEQGIGFYLRHDLLAMIAKQRGLAATAETVSIDDLQLDVLLDMPGHEPATLRLPLQEAAGNIRKQKDHRRFAVRMAKEEHTASPADACPLGMSVPDSGTLPRLLTNYTLKIVDKPDAGKREWQALNVDFHHKKANSTVAYRATDNWFGDATELVSWHCLDLPPQTAPRFVVGSAMFKIPHKIRVTGSVEWSSEPRDDDYNSRGYEKVVPLTWNGNTAVIAEKFEQRDTSSMPIGTNPLADSPPVGTNPRDKTPAPPPPPAKPPVVFTQTCSLTLDDAPTRIESFKIEFARQGNKPTTLTFKTLPLVYKADLGKTNAAFYLFVITNADFKEHLIAIDSRETHTVTETDPKTRKPVQSNITTECVGLRDAPGGIVIMLATHTEEEMQALVKSGKLSEADMDKAMSGLGQAMQKVLPQLKQ
jgi:hypothetical protein